jgi:geranylgeranyl transferase type-2 subunit alpha
MEHLKAAARAKKTEQYKMLAAEVLRRRAEKIYDEKSLGMTNKFLEVNPECYTVWNFRREMLSRIFQTQSEAEVKGKSFPSLFGSVFLQFS